MISIRKGVSSDVPAIAGILRELGWMAHIAKESRVATEARVAQQFGPGGDSHTVLVAKTEGGTIVGYVMVHWLPSFLLAGPEGYVSELFVREAERGLGIGSRLLDAVKSLAVERGCARLMLINGRNRPSYQRGFYHKLGWTERPEYANFILPLEENTR